MKIFSEWQATRLIKNASEEQLSKIQHLDINICGMMAETLDFWLTKFVMKVCKDTGENDLPRMLYRICCGIQHHLQDCNGVCTTVTLDKNNNRYEVIVIHN